MKRIIHMLRKIPILRNLIAAASVCKEAEKKMEETQEIRQPVVKRYKASRDRREKRERESQAVIETSATQ